MAIKWGLIPLMLFGIGYMIIGPRLSGDSSTPTRTAGEPALVNQQPIEPGERKWIPVSPPQVNVSVTRKVVEEDPLPPIEGEPPPIEIPDDGTVDEAGVAGLKPPVATGSGDATTGGTTAGEGTTTGGAFQGIGGRRF